MSSEDVFKTFSRRLGEDQYIGLGYTSSRRLQDVFKTSSRRLQDIFKTYHQVKLFILTRLGEAFNTFLSRSFPKTIIYRGICPGNTTSDKFMVSVKFARGIKISQVLVFQFITPLVAAFTCVFRTWSNIYNGAFLQKYLKALSC